jgi:transposase-like protein
MFSLIKSCQESGLSNKDFCQQHGIGAAMFYYWLKKLKDSELDKPERFIPVQVKKEKGQSDPIEITYPNGVRIKLNHTRDLSVIRILIGLA